MPFPGNGATFATLEECRYVIRARNEARRFERRFYDSSSVSMHATRPRVRMFAGSMFGACMQIVAIINIINIIKD